MSRVSEHLERGRAAVVERYGPWSANNIDLGHGVHTMAPGLVGVAEERVDRIIQVVLDSAGGSVGGWRVADLGCYEGAFAVELAKRGAEVLAVDGREQHVAKVRFAKEALGLDTLQAIVADMREFELTEYGEFDIVLCLGLLYHLPAPAVVRLVEQMHGACRRFAVIETQVSLKARHTIHQGGHDYAGAFAREDSRFPGAALSDEPAFWPTRPALLNLLQAVGFTSVLECLNPVIPALAAYRDHLTLVAMAGTKLDAPVVSTERHRWPQRLRRFAAPSQGWFYWLQDRYLRRKGGGLPSMFVKRPEAASTDED